MNKIVVFLTFFAATAMLPVAHANGPWNRVFQDYKFPSQAIMDHAQWKLAAAASASYVKSGAAISSSGATTITSFSAQPDFPRNITLTPTGTTANVAAGTAVVTGTNIFGKVISENFTIASAQSSATTGNKAFKSVTSIVFPQAAGSDVTLSAGIGSKLGLRHCVDVAGNYVFSTFGGAFETTRGTLAVSATAVESNTFAPNGSLDGSSEVDVFYVQNFRCYGN